MEKKIKRVVKPSSKSDPTPTSRISSGKKNSLLRKKSLSVGVVDKAIRSQKATWFVNKKLDKNQSAPYYPLGLNHEEIIPTPDAPRIDFKEIFRVPPVNPLILKRLVHKGIIHRENAKKFGFEKITESTPRDRRILRESKKYSNKIHKRTKKHSRRSNER